MKTMHYAIKRLQKALENNPSVIWSKEYYCGWIEAYSYYCGCKQCMKRLKESQVDINMLDSIFG